jgi:hypothetical protein
MKPIVTLLCGLLMTNFVYAQDTVAAKKLPDPAKKLLVVEASCGMCKFGMQSGDCSLAVRINGRAYYVEGANIDGFGDAHAADGFCNAVRKAQVQGEIADDKFKASYFKLLPGKKTAKTIKKKSIKAAGK